jgi:hypothetical protein
MKRTGLILVLTAMHSWLFSQNADDAIRYSWTPMGGTALSMSMGGATGAIGGDFTSASINPAGLGLYRQSEWGISAGLAVASVKSNYLESGDDDRKVNFNIPNIHLVAYSPNANRLKTQGWLSTTFSVGYNKQANLCEIIRFSGNNVQNSMVNAFIEEAGDSPSGSLNPFGADLAYQAFLIDPQTDSSGYTSLYGPLNGGVFQTGLIERRGRIGETSFSFAGNYSNRFYVGAGLAIRRIVMESNYSYTEENASDSLPGFNSFTYSVDRTDRGTSVAFRAGIIARVIDNIRLGASVVLPLDYRINTTSTHRIENDLTVGYYEHTVDNEYNFRLRQGARFTGSVVGVYGKRALLSLDFDLINYTAIRMLDEAQSFEGENDAIREGLRTVGNIRVGGELRFNELYARGGLQINGSPYREDIFGKDRLVPSIGFGLRESDYFFDVSYSLQISNGRYQPYGLTNGLQPVATYDQFQSLIVFSMGTRF